MNKKILIILIIIGALVMAGGICYWQKDNINKLIYCAKEDKTIGAEGMPSACCMGLKAVGGWPGGYDGDCSLLPPPTGLSICSNCGNKICEENHGENKCNCPEDCYKPDETADWKEIILTGIIGDEIPLDSIEEECDRRLESYLQSIEFENKSFSECKLFESKQGLTSEECPRGMGLAGCYICTLSCK
jgi:hypothetical protein